MAHVEKFVHTAVLNQIKHINREIIKNSNKDIDARRSYLNYSLTDHGMRDYEYYLQRKSQLKCFRRADVKTLAGWVVTAPKDLPVALEKDFFEKVKAFFDGRYGSENCVSAMVHKDESGRPHLHYAFIPVYEGRICAKKVLTQGELDRLHPQLKNFLREEGLPASVYTGITRRMGGNRTVEQMKAQRRVYEHSYDRR